MPVDERVERPAFVIRRSCRPRRARRAVVTARGAASRRARRARAEPGGDAHAGARPVASVKARPATRPSPSTAYPALISTAKARPRRASGEPRWTRTALQTTAAPFPAPATAATRRRSRRSARAEAASEAGAHHRDREPVRPAHAVDRRARRPRSSRATRPSARRPRGAAVAEVAGVEDVAREEDLAHVHRRVGEHDEAPGDEDGEERPRVTTSEMPVGEVAEVARLVARPPPRARRGCGGAGRAETTKLAC